MSMFTSGNTNTIRLQCLSNRSMANNIIRSSRFLNEPRLDRFQDLHVLNSLWYIPNLVGINHEDTSGRTSVLAGDRSWVDGCSVFGHVCWVIDDFSDEETSSKIVLCVGTDLELDCQLESPTKKWGCTLKWLNP